MREHLQQSFISTCLILCSIISQIAYASPAIDWILSTQNDDGSYVLSTDLATATQSTSEALSAFSALLENTDPGIPLAFDYLNSVTYLNTENLSRVIYVNNQSGYDVSDLLAELELYQNYDGGFGELPGYNSTPLDTAFSLIAMASTGYDDIDVVDAAISYLVNHQESDGSFILSDKNESSSYITALCLIAVQNYRFLFNVSTELYAANEYLLSQQIPGQGWGTAWETAVALKSIVYITTDSTRYLDSAEILRSQQLANGSWGDDVFITALAAQALYLVDNVKRPVSPTDGTFTGKIIRDDDLLPLASVQISIDELPAISAASDETGKFTLTGLSASTYTIRYQADGFLSVTQTVAVEAGQVVDLGIVRLSPLPGIGVISGTITDSVGGLPISSASIAITGAFTGSVTSDTTGKYAIAGVAGNVTIVVIASDYDPVVASGIVIAGDTLIFSPVLNPSGTIIIDPTVSITGSVIDGDTNLPVSQAYVEIVGEGQLVSSSAAGDFQIDNLAVGELIIRITHSNYQPVQYSVVASQGNEINLGVIRLYTDLSQPTTTTITGTVTDAGTGQVLTGAEVKLIETGMSVLTDINGRYRFENLGATQFTVDAVAVGYFKATGTVSITQPAVVNLDFRMNRSSASILDIIDMHIATGITIYPALSEIEADVILHNSGSSDQTVRMYYKVVNADSVIIDEGPVTVVPLGVDPSSALLTVPAGLVIETEIEWYNETSPPGDYQIIAQAYDGVTGQLLAERGISVTVEVTNRIGGAAEFNPPIAQLAANTPVQISAIVRNTGNQVLDPTIVTARLVFNKEGYQGRKDFAQLEDTITDTTFDDTRGMDIDSNGDIYVTNRQNNSVSRVAADGVITIFVENLDNPVDIDIAPSGEFYILNKDNSFVRIDAVGNRTETSTNMLNQSAIEWLANGRVLITQGNALHEVLPDGTINEVVSGGLAGPHDMVINSKGDIFIASADDNSISQYSNGTLSTFVSGINKPYGLAVDTNDDLIVTSYGDNSLLRITSDGIASVIATGLSGPFDVMLDDAGNYIVSNSMSNEIISVDTAGNTQVIVEQTINKPYSAVYNSAGDLFVGNAGFSNIAKFTPDGTVSEFAAGIINPISLLDTGDGGLDVLQSDGNILHISPEGTKTTIATGLSSSTGFAYDPGGDGYLVVESAQNRITHLQANGQTSPYAEPLLEDVRVMAVTQTGGLYVLAGPTGNRSIKRIAADKTVETIAQGMPYTWGMAVDANGNVYVTDYNARKILKIDATGSQSVLASTPFTPGAITATSGGNILLAPVGGKTIYTLNPDGSLTEKLTLGTSIMFGLVEDADGNLWTSDQNTGTVLRISPANVIDTYSVQAAGGIQADSSGGVYVGSIGSIRYIDSNGAITNAISHSSISNVYISTFARDENGEYWVPGANSITYLFNGASNQVNRFTTIKSPRGIIAGGNDNVVVLNGNGTIIRMRAKGSLPEVITTGSYRAIAKESPTMALVSSGGAARRLDLVTGALSSTIPYSSSTLSFVEAIAVNPAGGFVLGDYGHNRIHFYDANNVEIDVQAGLVNPRGLAQDQAGTVLVANAEPGGIVAARNDKRADIYLLDSNGFDYILRKPDGNIYASSRYDGTIYEYDQFKRRIKTLPVPESDAMVIDANGNLLSTMQSEGVLISVATDGSGTYQQLASGLSNAKDVETNASGDVYITDSSRNTIVKLNADNSLSLDTTNIQGAEWLSFSPNGDKLVTYAANRLALFESDGSRIELPLTNFIEPLTRFTGIDVDESGTIYISTSSQNSLLQLQSFVTEPVIQAGQVVYSASAQLNSLSIDGQVDVGFGAWTPTRSGEYLIEITADKGITDGKLTNSLHVGAKTDGQIVLTDAVVQSGDQAVNAVLSITGADPTKFTKIETQNLTLSARTFAQQGRAITADSQGNIFASDINKIVKVTPDGVVSDYVTGINAGIGAGGMVTDTSDTIFAPLLSGDIVKITSDGQKSNIGSFASNVEAVALDYNDELYAVTSAGKLFKVDKSSGAATAVPADGLDAPRGMTIDAYGNIYVLNKDTAGTGTDPIIRVTSAGVSSNFFDYASFEFEGIPLAADCSNNLLFAPIKLPPFKYSGEEDTIVQLIGETGEVNKILVGWTVAPGLSDIDVISYDRFASRLLFYTDLNNGEIFSFPIICGGIDVEAHIVSRADVDLSSADPAPTSIIDLGNGSLEYIWKLSGVDNQGMDIQLNMLLRNLAEGENRPILSDAYLEFTNSFNPDSPVQVAMDIPGVMVSSQLSIAASVNAAQYEADSLVNISLEVSNDSNLPFNGTVILSVIDANGVLVKALPDIYINALAAQSSVNLTSVWNTSITLAGDYAVHATLNNTTGETIARSEALYRILAGTLSTPVITASVSSNKPLYSAWDQLGVNSRVRNISSNAIQLPGTASVTVIKPDGTLLFSNTQTVRELYPNSYQDIIEHINLIDAVPGQYSITLNVNAATGDLLASSTASFDVVSAQTQALTGSVAAIPNSVNAGETVVCSSQIGNISGSSINNILLTQQAANIETVQVITEVLSTGAIAANGSLTTAHTINTSTLAQGDYACLLSATVAGEVKQLAVAGFHVLESAELPPVANAGTDQTTTLGLTVFLDGSGSSSPDGKTLDYRWRIVSAPAGSIATLNNATIVNPAIVVDKRGSYVLELIVSDKALSSEPATIIVNVVNTPPVANAGPDQSVFVGQAVILDGTASTDHEGDALSYQWSIISKPAGSNSTLSNIAFTMPELVIDSHGLYELQLVVLDGSDKSAADTVLLNVGNVKPVAQAGLDQAVQIGQTITLDGSASTDADGDTITYRWELVSQPADSSTQLSSSDTAITTLNMDAHGSYQVQLVVNDGFEDSEYDAVLLDAVNLKPVANAGPDMSVYVNDVVTFDGSTSTDADSDDLSYQWSLLSKPTGSTAIMVNQATVSPELTIDEHGMYIVQLIVGDGIEESEPDTVVLNVINVRPVANAGTDQSVTNGSDVILNGTGYDADGDVLSYQWSLLSQPAGSETTLVNPTTQMSQFVADQVGVYIAQLIADDGQLGSEPDTVTVTAVNQVPVCEQAIAQPNALWPPNHKFSTIALQGITDPDGDALTLSITGISQDEPVNATGDGNTGPDALVNGEQVQLRSERAGGGNGRIYSIYFTADDGVDQCDGSVTVSVPHNNNDNAIDDGQNYDATR